MTFKVGDKVTCSCYNSLAGRVFTITDVMVNSAELKGASKFCGRSSEWYHFDYLTIVPQPDTKCTHCGQIVVEKKQLTFTGSNTTLFHEVNGKLFRRCKYAAKEAGNTTDYNEYLLAELNTAKQILNDFAEKLGKHEPEPEPSPEPTQFCKHCGYPVMYGNFGMWTHHEGSQRWIACSWKFKGDAEPGGTSRNYVVQTVQTVNNLTVSEFAGRRKFRDE